MTRLPIPGADNGSWGEILNDFLRVEHNDDGTLKTSYVDSSQKGQAGGVAELDGGGKVPSSQLPASALVGDATAAQKGIMRLTGDLGGTADSPTVPGLAGKADSADLNDKVNKAGDTMTGALNVAVNSAFATVIGTGTNFISGISFQNRGFIGYDTANYIRIQGASTKGLQFGVDNNNFGSGTAATIDTTGQLGIGVIPAANNGYLQLPSSTSLATGGIAWGNDTNLYRSGANTLRTDDSFSASGVVSALGGDTSYFSRLGASVANSWTLASGVSGDAQRRLIIRASGAMTWGDGTNVGDTNLYRSAADTLRTDDNLIVAAAGTAANSVATIDATQTLTNKRLTRRVTSNASSATPTPDADTADVYLLTALAAAAAFEAPTGTPTDGQSLIIRIKDNGTARALSWNAIYRAVGVSLPTSTVISKTHYLGFVYNSADSRWDCLAVSQEA